MGWDGFGGGGYEGEDTGELGEGYGYSYARLENHADKCSCISCCEKVVLYRYL